MKLAIISHTEHYIDSNGRVVGWGATVREINNLIKIFSEVVHIAPLHVGNAPHSALPYSSDKIKLVPLIPSGGSGLGAKIKILKAIPTNLKIISRALDNVDYVQFRGPTNLGMYVIPYLSFRKKPKKWFKYAGNWAQKSPPFSYSFQRWWLKTNIQNSIVTVNGKWPGQQAHIISFENPCITVEELAEAKEIAASKNFNEALTVCFVGRVEEAKGVGRIIDTFKSLNGVSIEKILFVGDGPERKLFEEKAKALKFPYLFLGSLSRESLTEVYKQAHIFFLPSTASEGFPKVIAEAAAYGCVPIVSNISSIGQIIKQNQNGILLDQVNPEYIKKSIKGLFDDRKQLKYLSSNIVSIANTFTYDYYNKRLKDEVLPKLQ